MSGKGTTMGQEQGYRVEIPHLTPAGQVVSIQSWERNNVQVMHAESPDQSELYFEVAVYPDISDHERLAAAQRTFLTEQSPDGTLGEVGLVTLARHSGTSFDFRGPLQGRWKERCFLFLDSSSKTYRVVYDPTSSLNIKILQDLVLTNPTADSACN